TPADTGSEDVPRTAIAGPVLASGSLPAEEESDPFAPENWRAYMQLTRPEAEKDHARKLLREWRYKTWLTLYSHQLFGPVGIMPDSVVSGL
ncbi:hypothetical protein BV20DRAFT_906759, partial [Pilatotrama ljubarskyi]